MALYTEYLPLLHHSESKLNDLKQTKENGHFKKKASFCSQFLLFLYSVSFRH